MKFRSLAIAAVLAMSGSAFASTCTSNFALGSMGPPATKTFGNSFNGATLFSDCYDFSINAASNASGGTTEIGASFWFFPRFVDVLSVSLYSSLTGTKVDTTDTSPSAFSFGNLAAGGYQLVVGGYSSLGFGTASYGGTLTTAAATVASPVPEAPLPAMLAMAMIGAALVTRRAKRR